MANKFILTLMMASLLTCVDAKQKKHKKNSALKQAVAEVQPAPPPPIIPGVPAAIAASLRIDTQAEQALIMDYNTGKVLFEKNADVPMYPSSMTKIMTAYMAFDKMKRGQVQPTTPVLISEKAWRTGGSRMFLNVNTQATIDELLHGVIIQSGNDASVALAEGLSGSEEIFAAEMTQKVHEFGCLQTTFKNASGLPDPDHKTTARDLATIAYRVIHDYPEHYPLFAKTSYTYGGITQPNRHPLLDKNIGCDGLKTGMTDLGGYGVVSSVATTDPNGNQSRYIIIVNGCKTNNIRATESMKLANWVQKAFTSVPLAKKGVSIQNAPVYGGAENMVPVSVSKDAYVTVPAIMKDQIKYEIKFDDSVQAPIAQGQTLGKFLITAPMYEQPLEFDLIADKPVEQAGIFKKIWKSITHIFGGT